MNFEVRFHHRLHVWALRAAGVEAGKLTELEIDHIVKQTPLPLELDCRYFFSDAPVTARVTVFNFGKPGVPSHLKVEIQDEGIARKIRDRLNRYTIENDGERISDQEHKAVWGQIEEILRRDATTYSKLREGKTTLSRRAVESLMRLCEETEHPKHEDVYYLFTKHSVARADRVFVAQWLIRRFEKESDPFEQIGMRLWDLAVPQIADDLIRLIQDRRYGHRRGPLCLALAQSRHIRAAAVLVCVVREDGVTRWALEALGKLKAAEHAETVRAFLRHPDANVRREANRTLKKMGLPVETPPKPVHLVTKRTSMPKGLEEWSTGLDIEDLNPTLEKLARCIDQGFGSSEVAEVAAVADEMKVDQTRTFRFPIVTKGQKEDLWLAVFMDDIDTPDLYVYGSPRLIEEFRVSTARE